MEGPNPYAPPVADLGAPTSSNEHHETRQRLIKTETNIRSLGALVILGGVLSIPQGIKALSSSTLEGIIILAIAPVALFTGLALRKLETLGRNLYTGLAAFAMLNAAWTAAQLSSMRDAPPGVMQISIIQIAILALFLALLWGKNAKEIFTEHYRKVVIPATPDVKYKTSRVLIVLLVILLLGFAAAVIAAVAGR